MAAKGRVILITGASSGIGLAAATILAGRGWTVFATARQPEDIARLDSIDGVTGLFLDYTQPDSIRAVVEAVRAAGSGRIDALFNNGAYGQPGAVEDLTTDVLKRQFEANFFGWHELTRQVVPIMRAQGSGRIVQCSSILGFIALKYRGAYTASKHALEALTDTLRLELAGTGIEVSSIRPGPIATKFVPTSLKMFRANVDIDASPHAEIYRRRLARMERGGASRFKLPPEAVVDCLVHAVESSRPRPYYSVTTATKIMAVLKHLLPERAFITVTKHISDNEAGES
ncbi:Ribitol 2-dehydrogenase [Hartmannibacter diazotrophicus]|uniref:Ribitol 2-dehydrogenase n=1 Tax=Hartmannibacter diazotrophicus TaxID=1482074 RepID=A0A2C9D0X1_9HYPH|nr:SDR family oxidoreductase [Hartmannibacter diazotrophicus]SON53818.1 Ribitol 2-dehydrogenase [Hartmannibacter diazotrophicus]